MAMNGQLQFGAGMAVVGTIAFIVGLLWMSTALGDLGDSVDSTTTLPMEPLLMVISDFLLALEECSSQRLAHTPCFFP
jgi:hypothetical protein